MTHCSITCLINIIRMQMSLSRFSRCWLWIGASVEESTLCSTGHLFLTGMKNHVSCVVIGHHPAGFGKSNAGFSWETLRIRSFRLCMVTSFDFHICFCGIYFRPGSWEWWKDKSTSCIHLARAYPKRWNCLIKPLLSSSKCSSLGKVTFTHFWI